MWRRVLSSLVLGALVVTLIGPPAAADAIGDAKRQAKEIAAKLARLRGDSELLAEQYNDARLQAQDLDAQVTEAQARLASSQGQATAVRQRLTSWAVRAYVSASDGDPVFAVLSGDPTSDAAGMDGYSALALGADANLSDQLRQSSQDATTIAEDLANKLALQVQERADLAKKKKAAEQAVAAESQLLRSTRADLVQLIKDEEIRQAVAENARIKAQIEAQRAARQAGVATTVRHTPPPPSPGAAGAIAAAQSQIGVAYHFAQDDPTDGFDCSGLTAWAWGQAGKSLPHSSRKQFDLLTRIDPADLEPGDLVFFGRPVHHVGMYIGNGQMIHAPHTGDVVSIDSIYRRDLRGGGRP
jgi:cell wall-associated NlpC family hydrolase